MGCFGFFNRVGLLVVARRGGGRLMAAFTVPDGLGAGAGTLGALQLS